MPRRPPRCDGGATRDSDRACVSRADGRARVWRRRPLAVRLLCPWIDLLSLGVLSGPRRVPLSHVSALDFASPGAGRDAAGFNEFTEALEITLDPAGDDTERRSGVFHRAFRFIVETQHDARPAAIEGTEHHGAVIPRATGAAPRDPFVRQLLDDLGGPFLFLRADLRTPAEVRVVELIDLFHALHELRKGLELSPLVVCGGDGHLNVDGFLDRSHR